MKFICLIAVPFLFGCLDDRIDISTLNSYDKELFKTAAHIEGVSTTTNGNYYEWSVHVKKLGVRRLGKYVSTDYGDCTIYLSTDKYPYCDLHTYDEDFIRMARHELKHCKGTDHSKKERGLMSKESVCR